MENDEKIFGKDIFNVNLCSESIMYNYRGSTFEDIKCLTEEERKTFEFFQTQNCGCGTTAAYRAVWRSGQFFRRFPAPH